MTPEQALEKIEPKLRPDVTAGGNNPRFSEVVDVLYQVYAAGVVDGKKDLQRKIDRLLGHEMNPSGLGR